MTRVLVVDDEAPIRRALAANLKARGYDVDLAETGEQALELVARHHPDVVLLDLGLGEVVGFEVLRSIRARYPAVRVLVLTMHRDPETVRQALSAGAAGFVVKGAHGRELVDAIRAVQRGDRYLHSSVTSSVIEDSLRGVTLGTPLTVREREILRLLAGGLSAPQIGGELGISTHTVHRHVANMSSKLGVRGVVPLVRYAVEHQIAGA